MARRARLTMLAAVATLAVGGLAAAAPAKPETLAGVTIGQPLSAVTARWGRPVETGESTVPGARLYCWDVDPKGGIRLEVAARGGTVVLVRARLTGKASRSAVARYLPKAATGRGLALAGDDRKHYRGARFDYSHPSEDLVIVNYRCGDLTLICVSTFWGGKVALTEMTLVRRGFPKDWLPLSGPVG